MPQFRTLSQEQTEELFRKAGKDSDRERRRMIRQQYRDYLREMEPGQAVVAEIADDESKVLVRKRLLSAANSLGYQLEFKRIRNPGELPFRRVS